jgi:hypothetical protein
LLRRRPIFGSSFHRPLLALPPHAKKYLAVTHRFFKITAGLLVQSRKPAMRRHQSRDHGERSFECKSCAVAMSQTSQGDTEIEVSQGQEMLQPDREQGLFGGFFVPALAKPHHR